jgi:hypothetical protein
MGEQQAGVAALEGEQGQVMLDGSSRPGEVVLDREQQAGVGDA